jgi:RNA polymerase sigma factor (sigma-70 family)
LSPTGKEIGRPMVGAERQEARREADAQWSAWMAAAQAGDRVAYAALLRDCIGLVQRVACACGVRSDRVDDVVQETLLTVHRARQVYDPARSFTAWLVAIAERRAIDAMRRYGRNDARELHAPLAYEGHADPAIDPAARLEQSEAARGLRLAIAGLPPIQRQAVEQLGLRELSLADAAKLTGRSKGALKVNLHRALKTLKTRLGKED